MGDEVDTRVADSCGHWTGDRLELGNQRPGCAFGVGFEGRRWVSMGITALMKLEG